MRKEIRVSLVTAVALACVACGKVFEYPDPEPEQGPEACHDGADNDFDGSVDCDDKECTGHCSERNEIECGDRLDNDGDGLIDGDDPLCWHLLPLHARRCTTAGGIDTIENFDLPSWERAFSSWRRWGDSRLGPIVEGALHAGGDRHDPLIAFSGNTTDADELTSNLGALVRQGPFSGNWQEFELSFSASVPPGALLRAALVPLELAPSQETPLARTDTARIALTLDATRSPPMFALDFQGNHVEEEFGDCPGSSCGRELASVRLKFVSRGIEAQVDSPQGRSTLLRAPIANPARPLSPSRLVFWGGSVGPDAALLDDMRLKVSPEWPCGYPVPQIPGAECDVGVSLGRFGQSISVATGSNGEYCALIVAGPGAPGVGTGTETATAVTAWRSEDGRTWTPTAVIEPDGSVIGAAIGPRDESGWLAAVVHRDGESVRLSIAEGAGCDEWGAVFPGPALFDGAEAPSLVKVDGRDDVLFTRPPTDQTSRTLWRIALGYQEAVPELVAELPPHVTAPVSITRVGASDLVLTHPTAATVQSPGGVGLLVYDPEQQRWGPVGSEPLLELPPTIDLFGGHGRLGFDDRGLVAATLAWHESSRFILYSGRATGGHAAAAVDAAELAVGTAELGTADFEFEDVSTVPPRSCGDGICGRVEDCTSCQADCACSGPPILTDVFGSDDAWELVSTDPAPETIRYFDVEPPGLSWTGGEATWSVLPLERAVTGDFELSFDALVNYTDQYGGACVLNVGLGTIPKVDDQPNTSMTERAGVFARLLLGTGWFHALPLVLNDEEAIGESATEFRANNNHTREALLMEEWGHVVLRREGNTIRTLIPARDGCGFIEQTVTYAGPLGELPALLVGFGGPGLDGCQVLELGPGSFIVPQNGHGSIRNLELRLLDDPENCSEGKGRCAEGSTEPTCVDRNTTADHCGACGNRCAKKEVCDAGICVCNDAPGVTTCGGECVDISRSNEHCGACENQCTDGLSCVGGVCAAQGDCEDPFVLDPVGGTVVLGTSSSMPLHTTLCGRDVQDQVVLTWTPAASGIGVLDLDVSDSGLDSLLGITPYPSCEAWVECNDDVNPPGDLGSHVAYPVEAGVTYLIGAGVLWEPPVPGATMTLTVTVAP